VFYASDDNYLCHALVNAARILYQLGDNHKNGTNITISNDINDGPIVVIMLTPGMDANVTNAYI
jgi:hypothetical protein